MNIPFTEDYFVETLESFGFIKDSEGLSYSGYSMTYEKKLNEYRICCTFPKLLLIEPPKTGMSVAMNEKPPMIKIQKYPYIWDSIPLIEENTSIHIPFKINVPSAVAANVFLNYILNNFDSVFELIEPRHMLFFDQKNENGNVSYSSVSQTAFKTSNIAYLSFSEKTGFEIKQSQRVLSSILRIR